MRLSFEARTSVTTRVEGGDTFQQATIFGHNFDLDIEKIKARDEEELNKLIESVTGVFHQTATLLATDRETQDVLKHVEKETTTIERVKLVLNYLEAKGDDIVATIERNLKEPEMKKLSIEFREAPTKIKP